MASTFAEALDSTQTAPIGLRKYLPQLDGIRALAVFGVLVQHFYTPGKKFMTGTLGVYVFFILSGFLITRILLGCADQIRAGEMSHGRAFRQFYIRRFLRIFPVYYLYMAACYADKVGNIRSTWPWFALYLGNIYASIHREVFPMTHLWSLAVEEQFYLIWPCVVLFSSRRMVWNVGVLALITGLCSKLLVYKLAHNSALSYALLPCNLDTLASGALLAMATGTAEGLAATRRWLRIGLWPGVLVAAAGVIIAKSAYNWPFDISLMSAGVCLAGSWLIVRASHDDPWPMAKVLTWPPLRYIGIISYGIYVWHYAMPLPVASVQRRLHLPAMNEGTSFLMISLTSILVASGSWWFFERPINELKRYFPYLKSAAVPAGSNHASEAVAASQATTRSG